MFKRITITITAVAGLAVLTACGGEHDDGFADTESQSVDSELAATTPSTDLFTVSGADDVTTSSAPSTSPSTTPAPPTTSATPTTATAPPATTGGDPDDGAASPQSRPGRHPLESGPYKVCRPGPGKTITKLDPVDIPEVVIPEVRVDDEVIDGETVEGFVIDEYIIPAQTVDAGCIVEHDAPAGCLGAVEISPVFIPGTAIPGVELPDAEFGGEVVANGERQPAERTPGVRVPGQRVDRVCRQKPKDGESTFVPSVVRPAVVRPDAVRPALVRPALLRSTAQVGDGGFIDAVGIDGVAVDGVGVEAVAVDAEVIHGRPVEGTKTMEFDEPERTTFIAPSDVFFDTDEATIKADATASLQTIVAELAHAAPDAAISVEGHTDSRNTDAYNQDLSERRAQAVADWLIGEGGIDPSRINTVGYGESAPAAPNRNPDGSDNEAGMAKNRRVVISVATD